MRFYTKPHQFHCGIDLHARTMYRGNMRTIVSGCSFPKGSAKAG